MKDYKAILAKYKFTDEIGHPLENCQDFLDLLAETREAVKAEREACAKIAETDSILDWVGSSTGNAKGTAVQIANAIRARKKKSV